MLFFLHLLLRNVCLGAIMKKEQMFALAEKKNVGMIWDR